MKLHLRVVNAAGGAEVLEFDTFPVLIGRGADCDVVLDDGKASREHARILAPEDGRGDDIFVVEDLGSSNGTFVNCAKIAEAEVTTGDVIEVGRTDIQLVEEERSRTHVKRVSSGRLFDTTLGPAVAFLAVVGLAAWWFVWERANPPESEPVSQKLVDARIALEGAKADLLQLERIEVSAVARLGRLVREHGGVDFGDGTRPFHELHARVREQHELDSSNRLFELVRFRDRAIETGNFRVALRYLEDEGKSLANDDPNKEEAVTKLQSSVREAMSEGLDDLESEAQYLESMTLEDEARAVLEDALASYRGTSHLGRIRKMQEDLEERILASRKRREAELTARVERARKWREEAEPSKARTAKKSTETRPKTEAEKFAALIVRRKEGELLAVAERWSPEKMVREAAEVLRGKELLYAVRFAFRSGLEKEASAMLVKYHTSLEEGGARRKGDLRADRLSSKVLAAARGLASVPEGGFLFSRKHGWESAPDRALRVGLEDAKPICKRLERAKNVKVLSDKFADFLAIVERTELEAPGRGEVRKLGIAALTELRMDVEKKLVKRATHSAFRNLGQARAQLETLRAEALRIIFDTKIYLPKDHPDYSKVPEVNGQKMVDEAVDAVKELWNNAGAYALKTDGKSKIYSDLLEEIDEVCFPKLRHRHRGEDGEEGDALAQLRSNLNARVDLKTFSRNKQEADLYRYNRKVEAYNARLDEEDISESDKEHAKVINDYREMLGRRRVFLDVRLCRAARKHSTAMDKAGRIWHSGPNGTPSSRARAEGFPGGVAENVARGYANPAGIWWDGWYNSSGHHRNVLGRRHNCLGYGYVGQSGTQKFGSTGAPFK